MRGVPSHSRSDCFHATGGGGEGGHSSTQEGGTVKLREQYILSVKM